MFAALIDLAKDWIGNQRSPTVAPEGTSAKHLNDYLMDAWEVLGSQGRHPTSYTFRRAAFHRFIEDSKNSEGSVNWTKVASLSLHMNEKTVKAFYHLGVGKRKRNV